MKRRFLVLVVLTAAALVVVPGAFAAKPLPALSETPRDALTRALERGELTPAKYALERARALFDRVADSIKPRG